eukprot:15456094-Alexandrium_andersonii.AAC.1
MGQEEAREARGLAVREHSAPSCGGRPGHTGGEGVGRSGENATGRAPGGSLEAEAHRGAGAPGKASQGSRCRCPRGCGYGPGHGRGRSSCRSSRGGDTHGYFCVSVQRDTSGVGPG